MSLFKVLEVAGSAINAQAQRLNAVASNIANAESVAGTDGQVYRAKQVVFSTASSADGAAKVQVAGVVEDNSPPRRVYDPKNPAADGEGYVNLPNVNVVEEMVNMLSASRSYQNNIEVMNTAKSLLLRTLTLGQ